MKQYETPTALLLDINKELKAENKKLRAALREIKLMPTEYNEPTTFEDKVKDLVRVAAQALKDDV